MSKDGERLYYQTINTLADHISEHDLAEQLYLTVRALRAWRARRQGPPWVKIGKAVYYPRTGIATWLKSIEQVPVRSRRAA